MQMKSELYLRIMLLINFIMEENLFVNVEYSPVKHAASRFSVWKNNTHSHTHVHTHTHTHTHTHIHTHTYTTYIHHMHTQTHTQIVTPGWTDITGPGPVSFLSRISMYYIILTLHSPINLLNVVSTNSFSWTSYFTSLTTWCTNELRQLELAQ